MSKLKVWGGLTRNDALRKYVTTIIATTSRSKAAKYLGISVYQLDTYFAITGNDLQIKVAMSQPHVVFKASGNHFETDYKPTVRRGELSNIRMVAGNENRFLTVIVDNIVRRWVAIGWTSHEKATDKDRKLYPEAY